MRTLLTSLTALSLSVLVVQGADAPASHHSAAFEACAKACDDCKRECDMCAAHCAKLVLDGKKEHFKTQQTCSDCAALCSTASRVTARGGPFSDLICTACAEACKRCGTACDQLKADAMMKKCADECKKCEQACREMLKHTGPTGNASR